MGAYFRAVVTPVRKEDCMKALLNAWIKRRGARPQDGAVRLMAAQWGLETGWGAKGYCYNLGNMRTSKYDYTYIGGNEIIDGKVVWFSADKPSELSKFRAFATLDSAAEAYVEYLTGKKPVLDVLTGSCDPSAFTRALKSIGYFTDSVEHYAKGYLRCFDMVKDIPVPQPGPAEGYPTLAPDPAGDPAHRGEAPASAGEAPAAPADAVQVEHPPVVIARQVLSARRAGSSDPLPRIRIGQGPAGAAAPAAAGPAPQPGARRGAREIYAGLPEVISHDPPEAREAAIWAEVQKGNVPSFVRAFAPVVLTDAKGRRATVQVGVDCFAVGTDDDWLRTALSGYRAQQVADLFGCFLPTNRIVLEAYNQAKIRLVAHPFDCQSGGTKGRWQRSTYALRLHEDVLQGRVPCRAGQAVPDAKGRLDPKLGAHPGACALPSGAHPGVLVSGHLKEVILSHEDLTKRLAFWGFFTAEGRPIQRGFGCAHGPGFADYSHGFRLVKPTVDVDGRQVPYEQAVADSEYASLFFAEGGQPCRPPRYPPPPAVYYMGH